MLLEFLAQKHFIRFFHLFKAVGFTEADARKNAHTGVHLVVWIAKIFDKPHDIVAHLILRSLLVGQTSEMRNEGILLNEKEVRRLIDEKGLSTSDNIREIVGARLLVLDRSYSSPLNEKRAIRLERLYNIYATIADLGYTTKDAVHTTFTMKGVEEYCKNLDKIKSNLKNY